MTAPRFLHPLRAVERRLARARPRPAPEFTRRSQRMLWTRWSALERPPGLRLQVLGLMVAGVALLLVALVIALS